MSALPHTERIDLERTCSHFTAQIAAFADHVAAADPRMPVPTCPGWDLGDLIGHVGHAFRWAADFIAERSDGPPSTQTATGAPIPADPAERRRWLIESGDLVVREVRAAEADAAMMWSFLGPRPAAFWIRRMLNDLAVHRLDVGFALHVPVQLPGELTVDVIDEGLDIISTVSRLGFNPALTELRGDGRRLLFVATRPARAWLVCREPDGVAVETMADASGAVAEVAVEGSAQDLMALLNRRLPLTSDAVRTSGDLSLLRHWYDHTAM